jgi:uncharacterized protein
MTTRLAPIPFVDVRLTGAFWSERVETVLDRTIPSQHAKLTEMTILDSLKLPKPPPPLVIKRHANGFSVQVFWDSDVGKWIEAAAYALAHRRDEVIEAQIEAIIDDLEAAQAPDGYLNCWYLCREPENRWTNLRDNHELYNAGHLLEGAVAYFQTTGRRRLLDIMERYLDHIRSQFGTEPGKRRGYCGHPEIEMALVKLYRVTGDPKALALASYFVDERGASPQYFDEEAKARGEAPGAFTQKTHEYSQSHLPVRQQTKVVGHAVRAMYLYSAMADLAALQDDKTLQTACETLWNDLMLTKVYVTGGLGPSASNEGFTRDYDLPNATAYAETCAAVALVFWSQRMLHLDMDGRYADMLELALFNGALVGLSREGTTYFYANPLESDGTPTRWHWHDCPCCTMNVSRLVASVAGYMVSASDDTLAFHLYGGIDTTRTLGGVATRVTEVSRYPFDGSIAITVDPATPADFNLMLRVPGWCTDASATVNGTAVPLMLDKGYLRITRHWQAGDTVALSLPMRPERVYAHPSVSNNAGRVALRHGPLVYCVEEVDHGAAVQRLRLPRDAELTATPSPLFDGIVTITGNQYLLGTDAVPLYFSHPPQAAPTTLTAIPYYAWNNRGQGSMLVWIPEI